MKIINKLFFNIYNMIKIFLKKNFPKYTLFCFEGLTLFKNATHIEKGNHDHNDHHEDHHEHKDHHEDHHDHHVEINEK
jgi:hypothetical protein